MSFTLSCNEPGIFTLALYYKGREKVLMEKSWTIDDLLAKVSLQSMLRQVSRRRLSGLHSNGTKTHSLIVNTFTWIFQSF